MTAARSRLVMVLLAAGAILARLPNLGQSLWLDEVLYSTNLYRRSLAEMWHFAVANPHAPLYPLLSYFWAGIVPDTEIFLRLPSVVAGTASVVLTYVIARRAGSEALAVLAGIFAMLSPALVWYSQEATPYAWTVCAVLAAVAVAPLAGDSRRGFAAYLLALVAAVTSHFLTAVLLIPLTVSALRSSPSRRAATILAHAIVVIFLAGILGLKYVTGTLTTTGTFLRPFTLAEAWLLLFDWFLYGNTLAPVGPYTWSWADLTAHPALLAVQVVAAAVVVRGLFRRDRQASTPRSELGWLLITPLAVMWLFTLTGRTQMYIERYLLVCLPFFLIALARGLTGWTNIRVAQLLGSAGIALAAAGYIALLWSPALWTVYKVHPDWRKYVPFPGGDGAGGVDRHSVGSAGERSRLLPAQTHSRSRLRRGGRQSRGDRSAVGRWRAGARVAGRLRSQSGLERRG